MVRIKSRITKREPRISAPSNLYGIGCPLLGPLTIVTGCRPVRLVHFVGQKRSELVETACAGDLLNQYPVPLAMQFIETAWSIKQIIAPDIIWLTTRFGRIDDERHCIVGINIVITRSYMQGLVNVANKVNQ